MSFYSKHIFPYIVELALNQFRIGELRSELLSNTKGRVLEVGFGTGLNLPHYPKRIKNITAIDPNLGMHSLAKRRMKKSKTQVELKKLSGDQLPFPNNTFDCVVTSFTLCSIAQIEAALLEIHRVLKPSGQFLFLEHGLGPNKKIQILQGLLNPIEKRIADGCHLNRDIPALLKSANFKLIRLKQNYHPRVPKIMGYFYQGIGVK